MSPRLPPHRPDETGIAARARAAAAHPPYLSGLNPEQRDAVETLSGPVLVLAGAGTGKTRVLTTRIAHILSKGQARSNEILAVTFTNKAAREMKHRLGAMLGEAVEGMAWLGTFHSIGARILRIHAELAGLNSNFTVLDTDDQVRLIKQLLQAADIDDKRWPARMLVSQIDGWKNRGLTPAQVPAGEAAIFANGKGGRFYAAYQERLKTLNAADFGDLLLENIRLFRTNTDILRMYQERFRYILVDEYQDTNVAQYLWLRLLAQAPASPASPDAPETASHRRQRAITPPPASRNICCVGDDDQSIYGWRGAEVDNILRFEQDFPGAKVIRLERNYRSTGHILAAASHLIAHNQSRLGKTLRTEDQDGEKVIVAEMWNTEEEARAVGEDIEALHRAGQPLNQIAILVRASFQMREFEDCFVALALPYRVIGGPRFYERAEIRDALAYLRVINSPADDLAFERIINVPKRGLGDATLNLLHDHARRKRMPLFEAARAIVATNELKAAARGKLRQLIAQFDHWREICSSTSHSELAGTVLDESGYTDMWRKDTAADSEGRLENLKELLRSMEEFPNLQGFLEHIALVMDRDSDLGEDAVSLMTLHSAKGLEFDNVFLPGWEDGLFPSQRTLDGRDKDGLEEERRLAHVGLTRARRRASISFVRNRFIHGNYITATPSRFIDELPPANVMIRDSASSSQWRDSYSTSRFDDLDAFDSSYSTPGWRRAKANPSKANPTRATPSRASRSSPHDAGPIKGEKSRFAVGKRVIHDTFGKGMVIHIDGNKLTVVFEKSKPRKILDSYVKPA